MLTNPAGFWRRLAANLLDALIISVPLAIISYMISGNWDGNDPYTNVLDVLYALILPVIWHGHTIGKKIMGIHIAKMNGSKLGFGAMFMRTVIAGLLYLITFGVGIIVSAFMVGLRADKRSLHDMIAGTYVTFDGQQETKEAAF